MTFISVDKTHFYREQKQKTTEMDPITTEMEVGHTCGKACTWPSKGIYRFYILAMLFIGTFTAYVLRVNINIAIIDMLDVPASICNNSESR